MEAEEQRVPDDPPGYFCLPEAQRATEQTPREVMSAYLARNPSFAKRVGDVDDELLRHFEKFSEQLFGQPAFA